MLWPDVTSVQVHAVRLSRGPADCSPAQSWATVPSKECCPQEVRMFCCAPAGVEHTPITFERVEVLPLPWPSGLNLHGSLACRRELWLSILSPRPTELGLPYALLGMQTSQTNASSVRNSQSMPVQLASSDDKSWRSSLPHPVSLSGRLPVPSFCFRAHSEPASCPCITAAVRDTEGAIAVTSQKGC